MPTNSFNFDEEMITFESPGEKWARRIQLALIFLIVGAVVGTSFVFSFFGVGFIAITGFVTLFAVVINYKSSPFSIFEKLANYFLQPAATSTSSHNKEETKVPTTKIDNNNLSEEINKGDSQIPIGGSDNNDLVEILVHCKIQEIEKIKQEEISSGAFGAVFSILFDGNKEGRHVIKRALDKNDITIMREAETLPKFNHKNIIKVNMSFFDRNNNFCLIMPRLTQSLQRFIEDKSGLSDEETKEIVLPALKGIEFLHDNKYVHHDIKPDNILLKFVNNILTNVCIADFGFVSKQDEKIRRRGSPAFMPPEKLNQYVSKASSNQDIYSIACVIFVCKKNKPPFEAAKNEMELTKLKKDKKIIRDHVNGCGFFSESTEFGFDPDPKKRPTALQMHQKIEFNSEPNQPQQPFRSSI